MKWGQPFDPASELVWVGASITSSGGEAYQLHAVLDIGTSRTLIERSVAEAAGLHEGRKIGDATFRGVAGPPVRGYRVIVPEFIAFGRAMKDFEVICVELSEDLEVDCLVGLDFLRGLKVVMDFRVGLISLEA